MRDQKKNFLSRSPFKRSFLSIALSVALLIVFPLFIASTADAQAKAKASSGTGSAPTEAILGAPIYPGSTYDAQNSQGMSDGGSHKYYIFISNDPTDKVAAFYEQKLKVKAGKYDKSYMIPLKGALPMPDEGISIQPNTLGGKSANAKTMITFQKQTK
jgi:hypothetical protein